MQEHFNKEVEDLNKNLLKMASMVDEQVEKALFALETGDVELCKGIKSKDVDIDAFDNKIQAQCENILALFQPFAADLRYIISVLMINNQLERCGDIAVNIAQRVKRTYEYQELLKESRVFEMGRKANLMLKDAIDCFIHNNGDAAKEILFRDKEVNKLNKKIFDFAIEKMHSEKELITPSSHLIILTRHIERLADHATNIAENIIFYVDAIIIAHKKKLDKREKKEDS